MAARGRKKALATLRTILRHVAPPPRGAVAEAASTGVADVDDALMRTGGGTETRQWIRGGSSWRSFVLEQYRVNKNEKDRSRVKVLRSQAADYAMLLTSLAEQQVRCAQYALRPTHARPCPLTPLAVTMIAKLFVLAFQQRLRYLDMGADMLLSPSDRAARSAKRVGLQVPGQEGE